MHAKQTYPSYDHEEDSIITLCSTGYQISQTNETGNVSGGRYNNSIEEASGKKVCFTVSYIANNRGIFEASNKSKKMTDYCEVESDKKLV
jgi:hypothetical protein